MGRNNKEYSEEFKLVALELVRRGVIVWLSLVGRNPLPLRTPPII